MGRIHKFAKWYLSLSPRKRVLVFFAIFILPTLLYSVLMAESEYHATYQSVKVVSTSIGNEYKYVFADLVRGKHVYYLSEISLGPLRRLNATVYVDLSGTFVYDFSGNSSEVFVADVGGKVVILPVKPVNGLPD
jgi:hypothetical protein